MPRLGGAQGIPRRMALTAMGYRIYQVAASIPFGILARIRCQRALLEEEQPPKRHGRSDAVWKSHFRRLVDSRCGLLCQKIGPDVENIAIGHAGERWKGERG